MKNLVFKTFLLLAFVMVSFIGKAQNYLNFTITNNSTACTPVNVDIITTMGTYTYLNVAFGTPVILNCQLMGIPTSIRVYDRFSNFNVAPNSGTTPDCPTAGGSCSGSGCVGTGITANSTMPGPVGPPPGGCGFLGFLYTLTINLY
jgi:hypothetical protein